MILFSKKNRNTEPTRRFTAALKTELD